MHRSLGRAHVLGLLLAFGLCSVEARAYAACPDGVVDPGETCDDGNATSGDGCASSCQIEAGFVCTGAPSLCCFSDAAAAYHLIGSATTNSNTGEVTLTPELTGQAGYAWYKQRISFASDFRVNLKLYLGTRDADGADGGAILFQRHPNAFTATGSSGGGLGAGFSPLVGVEFDDWNNGAGSGDVADDHVSIFKTGVTTQLSGTACMNVACSNFEDGSYHRYEVIWTAASNLMEVKIDGVSRISLTHDLVANVFGGDPSDIIFGFAASTGGSYNLQKFCPSAPEGFTVPRDADGDGVDDSVDRDDDNDGVSDVDESANVFGADDPGADHDVDGIPNWEDTDYWTDVLENPGQCADAVAPIGKCDSTPTSIDADGDGVPNHLDSDSDNDTIYDVVEAGGADANNDGRLDGCSPVDVNGSCMGGDLMLVDSDNDGIYDIYDTDSDNDGIPDSTEGSCQSPGAGASCNTADADGDGLTNAQECADPMSCPDTDGDEIPDYLDTDSDNDGVNDIMEADAAASTDPCSPSTDAAACTTGDADEDGLSNGTECSDSFACPDTDGDTTPDYLDTDSDNDGVDDALESSAAAAIDPCTPSPASPYCTTGDADVDGVNNGVECPDPLAGCPDSDGDGTLDYLDTDSDDDGEADATDMERTNPCVPSTDAARCSGGDADNDGVNNGLECPNPADCVDSDNDGTPDYLDSDSDNDGTGDDTDGSRTEPCMPSDLVPQCATGDADGDMLTNGVECPDPNACRDTDNDTVPDYLDSDSDADGASDLIDDDPIDPCSPSTVVAVCASGDSDNDGVDNGTECPNPSACPDSDNDGTEDYLDLDSDNDGTDDQTDSALIDPCAPDDQVAACGLGDPDNDGVQNSVECTTPLACPDTDNDGTPDYQDVDSDDDGVEDDEDGTRLDPCTPASTVLACASGDYDADGVTNGTECPNRASCPDSDNDGTPDYRDTDSDNDGVPDTTDDERTDPCDPSSDVPVCGTGDADEDGVPNNVECMNPSMCPDTDMDGTPDYQDTDSDNDGTPDATDMGAGDPCVPITTVAICASGDADEDGVTNGAECPNPAACVDTDMDGTPDYQDTDSDNDGTSDELDTERTSPCEPSMNAAACRDGDADNDGIPNGDECPDSQNCPDTDRDGDPDFEDNDSDGDGIPDMQECAELPCADADSDGLADYLERSDRDSDADGLRDDVDSDSDGDGTPDGTECSAAPACPDSDGDGIADHLDAADSGNDAGDSDGDGLLDDVECGVAGACIDSDGDHIPDYMDRDSDADGVDDAVDPSAVNPCVPDSDLVVCTTGDADGDGVPNGSECSPTNCPDSDGDGLDDHIDPDSDNDGTPDGQDSERLSPCAPNPNALRCGSGDYDGDGIRNDQDSAAGDACSPDGMVVACGSGDADGDGVKNSEDTKPSDACTPNVNALACGMGDTDGDGVKNSEDSRPSDACRPSAQAVACGRGDTDADGVRNSDDPQPRDPCQPSPNALACATGDSDGDGIANVDDEDATNACVPDADDAACDSGDLDGDGVPNADDAEPDDACVPETAAVRCATGDADGDGVPNEVECPNPLDCVDTDGDGTPDVLDTDSDGDGIDDAFECAGGECVDANDNGIPDHLDDEPVDSDGDGVSDFDECGAADSCADTDGDGIPDSVDTDDDGDGISTEEELAQAARYGNDVDGDGIPNHLDADADGDGIPDSEETGDLNRNGTPDYLEVYSGPEFFDDDGCGCSAGGSSGRDLSALWLLPLLALLERRRRRTGSWAR